MNRDPETGRFARTPEQAHADVVIEALARSKPLRYDLTNLGGRRTPPPPGRIDMPGPPVGRYADWELRQMTLHRR